MSRNPYFVKALDEMQDIHDRKNADYAHESNPFSNFEHAAAASGIPVIRVFDVLLGVKQARLSELSDTTRTPNNESIRDTLLDRAVYATIALAYYDWVREGRPVIRTLEAAVEVDPSAYARKGDAAATTGPSFAATLEKAGALTDRGAPWPHLSATLNPHRHVRDTDGFPPPNPITDVADMHTEGD